jgi:hypothetical protein
MEQFQKKSDTEQTDITKVVERLDTLLIYFFFLNKVRGLLFGMKVNFSTNCKPLTLFGMPCLPSVRHSSGLNATAH